MSSSSKAPPSSASSSRQRTNTTAQGGREKAVVVLPDTTPLLLNPPPNAPITSLGVSPLDGAVITTHSNGVRFYKLSSSTRIRSSVHRASPQQQVTPPATEATHNQVETAKETPSSSWAFASAYLPSSGSTFGKAATKISETSATWRSTLTTSSSTPTASPEPEYHHHHHNTTSRQTSSRFEEDGSIGGSVDDEDPTLGGIAYVQYRHRHDIALQGSYLVVTMDPALASPSLQDQHCHPKLAPMSNLSTSNMGSGGLLCTNPSLLRHLAIASCSTDSPPDAEDGGGSTSSATTHSVSIITSSETSNLCITHSLHERSPVSALTTSAVNFRRLNGVPDSIFVVSGDQRGRIVLCDTQAHFMVSHGRDIKTKDVDNNIVGSSIVSSITVGGLRGDDRTMPIVVCSVEQPSSSSNPQVSSSSAVAPQHPMYAVEIMVHRIHIPPAGVNAISLVNSTMVAIDSLKMPPLRNKLSSSSTSTTGMMMVSFRPTRDCNIHSCYGSSSGGRSSSSGGVILAPRSKGRILVLDACDGTVVTTETIPSPSSTPSHHVHRQEVLLSSLAAEWDWATQIISLGSSATTTTTPIHPANVGSSSSMVAAITTGGQVVLLRISSNNKNVNNQSTDEQKHPTSTKVAAAAAVPPQQQQPPPPVQKLPPTASVEEYEARDQAALEAFLGSDDDDDSSSSSNFDSDSTSDDHIHRTNSKNFKNATSTPAPVRNTTSTAVVKSESIRATPVKMVVVKRSSGLSCVGSDGTNDTSGASTPRLQQAAVPSSSSTPNKTQPVTTTHDHNPPVYYIEEVSTLYDPKAHASPSNPTSFEEAIPSHIYYEPYMRSVLLYFAASQHLVRVDLPSSSSNGNTKAETTTSDIIVKAKPAVIPKAAVVHQPKKIADVLTAKSSAKGAVEDGGDDEPTSLLRSVVGFGISSWGLAAGYVNKTSTTTPTTTSEPPGAGILDPLGSLQQVVVSHTPSLDQQVHNPSLVEHDTSEGEAGDGNVQDSTTAATQLPLSGRASRQSSTAGLNFDETVSPDGAQQSQRPKKIVKVIVKKKRVKASSIVVQSPPPKRGSTAIKPTSVEVLLEEQNRRQAAATTEVDKNTADGEFNVSQLRFISRSSAQKDDDDTPTHHHVTEEDEVLFTVMKGKRALELDLEPAGRDVIQTTFFREWRERHASFEQELEAIIIVKRILQQADPTGGGSSGYGNTGTGIQDNNTSSVNTNINSTTASTTSRRPPPSSKSKQQPHQSPSTTTTSASAPLSPSKLPIREEKAILESQIGTCVEPRYVCDNIPLINNMSYGFLFEYRRVLDRNALEEKQQKQQLLLSSSNNKQRDINDCVIDDDDKDDLDIVGHSDNEDYLRDSVVLGDIDQDGDYHDPSLNIKLSAAALRDPTYLAHIHELQDRDRIAYEMSEIEHRFKDRLAKVVEVETVEIEENSRLVMPNSVTNRKARHHHYHSGAPVKKQWAPHSNIRFQHLDGSRVDWISLNATFPQSVVEMKTTTSSSHNPVSSSSSIQPLRAGSSATLHSEDGGGSSAGGGQSYTTISIMSSRQGPPSSCYLREGGGNSHRGSRSRGGSVAAAGTYHHNTSTTDALAPTTTTLSSATEASDTAEHALWTVGQWRYAKVFPPHDPAPESYWCSYEEAREAAKRQREEHAARQAEEAAQSPQQQRNEPIHESAAAASSSSSKLLSSATGLFSTWSFGRGKSKSPEPSEPTTHGASNTTAPTTPTVSMTTPATISNNNNTAAFPFAVRRRTLTRTRVRCLDHRRRRQLESEREDALQEARRRLGLV